MTLEEATIKAVKLLRLAQSENENEAALAMSRAQELIDRHKLGALSLDFDTENPAVNEPIRDFGADPLDPDAKKLSTWRYRLADAIAKMNQCTIYRKHAGPLAVVGRPSNVSAVRYLFNWMRREVERLSERDAKGFGATFLNNFRIGIVETVAERLREHQKETQATVRTEAVASTNSMALVHVNNAIMRMEQETKEVHDWAFDKLNLRKGSSSRASVDPTARALGRVAGKEVRIQPSRGDLANRRCALPSI